LAAVTAITAWPVSRWAGKTVTRRTERSAHRQPAPKSTNYRYNK